MFGTALVGTTIWGGLRQGMNTPPITPIPPPVMGLHLWIGPGGGVEYSDHLRVSTLRINDEINARSSADFTLVDPQRVFHFQPGQPVRVMYNTGLIFSGFVDEVEEELTGHGLGNTLFHNISCTDWTSLADRHLVAGRYEVEGQTLKDIVWKILYSDSGDANETLYYNGIRLDPNMDEGPPMGTVTFDYVTCAEAFDQLSEKTGYWWKIQAVSYDTTTHAEVRYLKFFELSKNPAPYELNPDVWGDWRNLSVRRSQEKYRNLQFLRAGKAHTAALVRDSFHGKAETVNDKSEMIYTLRYPIWSGAKPKIYVNDVEIAAAKIDIQTDEVDQSTIEWFYTEEGKQITQANRDGFNAMISTDDIDVDYYGVYPILIQARADQEIDARAILEGGVGIHADMESDDAIDDMEMALERANGLIRRYGRIPSKVQFETDTNGFAAGHVLTVNLADHGLHGIYLIESVDFSSVAEKFFRYTINAIEGEGEGGTAEFWRRLAQRTRPPVIGENETLLLSRQPKEGVIVGDAVSMTEPLIAFTLDDGTHAMVGGYGIGMVKEDGVVVGPIIGYPYGSGA